ncbi:hypothetical protein [Fimbriiglobus ruber]|uniref:hypothetical protein n=1 Tax=Fimbriiglobus ruber TaxID=1908690 RepID=UPI000B4B95D8|nr:hypothetical protein [Fimbriiglobus ruber]
MTDVGLANFKKNCTNLFYLELFKVDVTDSGLAYFQNCKAIKTAQLAGTKVTDQGILQLCKDWTELVTLDIDATKITPSGVEELKKILPQGCSINYKMPAMP